MKRKKFQGKFVDSIRDFFKVNYEKNIGGIVFDLVGEYDDRVGRYFLDREYTFESYNTKEIILYKEIEELIDKRTLESLKEYLKKNYKEIAPSKKDHMKTTIVMVMVGEIEQSNIKSIQGFNFYRSYLFGIRGWVEVKLVCVDVEGKRFYKNKGVGEEFNFIDKLL